MMAIVRRSPVTGKMNYRNIDISNEEYYNWEQGIAYLQDIAPHLSPEDREFIISGCTPEDFDFLCSEEEEE